MKTILTILLTAGVLSFANAMPGPPDSAALVLTKHEAKEMGMSKADLDKVEALNEERERDIKIANIVYKNHPVMRDSKVKLANDTYLIKLQNVLHPDMFQALSAR